MSYLNNRVKFLTEFAHREGHNPVSNSTQGSTNPVSNSTQGSTNMPNNVIRPTKKTPFCIFRIC